MLIDDRLPRSAVDLSDRLRRLRQRSGQTQSAISRALGLDPSIPSLWEQGRRLVPPTRLVALAGALEVSLDELLEGIDFTAPPRDRAEAAVILPEARWATSSPRETAAPRSQRVPPPLTPNLHPREAQADGGATWALPGSRPLSARRSSMPTGEHWVPAGWEPTRALPAWDEDLPEGLWLDATRLDRPNTRRMLQERLCADDHALVGDRRVNSFALAERLFQHCARQAEWRRPVPVAETLFRAVLGAPDAGLMVERLVETLDGRIAVASAVRLTLVRRLGPALRRAYPVQWARQLAQVSGCKTSAGDHAARS